MRPINWPAVFEPFDECEPRPGLNPEYVPLVDRLVGEPLSKEEIAEIESRGLSDPNRWVIPSRPLPKSYLSFLAWSNGGIFIEGDREFAILGAEELREYLLTYELPATMAGSVPFATDGHGGFYLIDMRNEANEGGEHPILHALVDRFTYDDAEIVATAFPELFLPTLLACEV